MTTAREDGDGQSYSISAGLDVVILSADEILVQFGTRSHPSELFRDADLTGILGRAIGRLLDGPATLEDLVDAAGVEHESDVRAMVTTLADRGMVTASTSDPVAQYLEYALKGSTELAAHTVAIVGCGPVGARIASSLGEHGIGSLLLADDRRADDLWHRFMPTGMGGSRAFDGAASAGLASSLSALGSRVERVERPLDSDGLDEVLGRATLTILALEQVDLRLAHVLNRVAVKRRRPWLHTIVDGDFGVIGPLFEPPHTACFNDFQVLRIAATPSAAMVNCYQRHVLARDAAGFAPGLPVHADLVAAYAVLAALHYLLSGSCFAFGRAMFVNFEQMAIDIDDVLTLPRCPVCGSVRRPGRPAFTGPAVSEP